MYCSQALFGASQAWRLAGPQFGLGRLAPVTVLMRATLIFEAVLVQTALLSMCSSQYAAVCVCKNTKGLYTFSSRQSAKWTDDVHCASVVGMFCTLHS